MHVFPFYYAFGAVVAQRHNGGTVGDVRGLDSYSWNGIFIIFISSSL